VEGTRGAGRPGCSEAFPHPGSSTTLRFARNDKKNGSVVTAIGGILSTRAMTLGTDLRFALAHYLKMIRRHVLDEDRKREIALKLYQKHQERLAQERLVNFLDANLVAVALTVLSVVDPDPLPPVTWR
jgi:hypothetical protein